MYGKVMEQMEQMGWKEIGRLNDTQFTLFLYAQDANRTRMN